MKKLLFAVFAAALVNVPTALAGDIAAGKTKAAMCGACHGTAGISAMPLWPNLAGQKDQYLVKQMKAFRDGTRKDPAMSPMATALTDADIDNLAAYYSSLGAK